tara:strand:- start:303 stop:587 length:285 start_codon:yes stop_codon:yes gene_type:complete
MMEDFTDSSEDLDVTEEVSAEEVEKKAPRKKTARKKVAKKTSKKVVEKVEEVSAVVEDGFPGFPGGSPRYLRAWRRDRAAWEAGDESKAKKWGQ